MKRFLTAASTLAILGACVIIAIRTQDISHIAKLLRLAQISYVSVSLLLTLAGVILTSVNLYLLLQHFKHAPRWSRVFELDLLSLFGVYYTPGASGGVAFLVYKLNQENVDVEDVASCLLVDKVITAFLALCSLVALLLVRPLPHNMSVNRDKLVVFGVVLVCLCLLLILLPSARRLSRSVVTRVLLFRTRLRTILVNLLVTMGIFLLSACQFLVAFRAIHASPPPLFELLLSYGPLALITYLPFTIGGAGVAEAAGIAIWRRADLSSEQIIAAFVVARVFSWIAAVAFPGLIYAGRLFRKRSADNVARG